MNKYKMPKSENMNIAFEIMANYTENFLRKYGNPHTTVIADQRGIEVLQGTKAKSFELNDDIEFTDTINFVETSEPNKVANTLDDLQHRLEVAEKALELAVADKCRAENIIAESLVGKGAKVSVPKKEQWYFEQAEAEINKRSNNDEE